MRLQVILKHRSYILKDFTLNVSFHIEKGNNLEMHCTKSCPFQKVYYNFEKGGWWNCVTYLQTTMGYIDHMPRLNGQ